MLTTLRTWRDAMRARLIDDWSTAHRFWSVRLMAAAGGLKAFAQLLPGYATEAWNSIPPDMRSGLPGTVLKSLPLILIVLALVARVSKQKDLGNGQ